MLHVLFFFTYRTIFIGYSSNCEVTLINSFYEYSEMQDLTVAKNILVSGLDLGSLVVSAKTKLENARINRIESEGDSTERYIVGGYINYKPANISLTFHQLVSSLQTSGLGGIITQPNAINGADGDLYTNLKPEDIEEFVVNSFAKPSNEFADIMKKLISERSDLKENIEKAFDQIMFFAEDSDNSFISELAKSRIKANSHDDFIRSLLIRLDNKEQGIELKHSDNLVALIGDDPSSEGYVRATYFGPKGFTGHVTRPDYQSLLDLIASEGYVKDGTGSLERFAKLNSFSTGNEISSLIADVNSNRITFKEFINLSNDLSKDDDNPESASFDIDSFASPDRDTVLNLYQSIVDSDTSIHYGDSIRILIPGEDGDDRQILASVGKNNIVLNELVIPDDPTTPLQIINYVLDHFGNEVSRQSFGVEADTIQKLQDSGFRINKPIEIVLNSNLSFRAEFERQSHTNKHDSIFPVSGVINGESYNALVSCNSKSSGILNLRSIYMEDGDKRMFIEEGRLDSNNDYEIINPRKIAKAVDVAIFCKLNVSLPEYRASQNPLVTDFGYPENEVEDYVANPILGQGDFDNKDDYILQCLMHEDNFRSSLLKQALKKLEALNKPARYKNKTHYEWLSSLSNLSPSRKEALDDYVFAVGAIDTNNAQYQNRYDFAASEWDTFHSKHLNENLNSEYDFFQNWSAEQSRAQLSESQVKLLDYIDSAMESVGNHESAVIDYISGNHPKFFPKNILTTNSSGLGQIGAEIQKAIYYKDSLPLSDIVSSSSNQLKVESPQTVMKLEPEPDQLGSRLKNTIVNNAPETPLAANHDTFGDFYSALIDAKRTELNNKVAILELKLIALNLSEHPDLASSEFEEWAKSKSDDPVIAETLISYLSASDDLSKFNDTGHDALKLDAQNLWDNAHINSTASIADSMAGKGESKSSNKTIKDYGEKVPGAAKDRWVSYMINLNKHHDPELTSISKFLPSPNYQSLWKKGVSKEKLSLAALVISVVPTGRGITSRRQIKDQSTKAIHAKRILTQVINFDGDIKAIETSIIKDLVHSTGIPLDCISMHHDLFKGFEPEHYKKLSGFEISQQFGNMQSEPTFAMKYPGGEFAFRNSLSSLYQPRESFKPRILAAAKEFIDRPPVEKKPKITKFRVYTDRKTNLVYIGFELPNSSLSGKDRIVRLKEFGPEAKPKDGFQYISENRESLDKELNKLKNFELRKQFNKTRIGSQWRSDDISNKDLIETFGAKGVEFGNSLPENERQDKMNQVYDALCDLASVTNIDRKALGLNGNLTLGLATRGKGGKSPANASYFPYYRVINLTRNNGAGSLAHEMLHAIDHHYGIVGHESFDAINNAPADLSTSMATSAPPMKTNELRPEMREAFISLIDAISHPELVERYVKLDGFRKEPYLSKTIEIAARSFEKYVQLKLEEKNIVNEFLVNTNESHHSGSGFAYPSTEEMHKFGISDSFDNLFTQMKTLETDRGLALYKLDSKSDAINSEWLLNSALNISSFGNVNIDVDEISDALLKNEILASSVRHDFIDSRYPREHVINTYFIDFGSQQDIALFKQVATVYESEDKVWMEINNSSENEDALFRVLADYSLSSGKTFYGDPESDSAIHLENMLSSAIRHGTASHINPNGFINGSSDVVSWSFSDNQNLQSLLKGSQSNIFKMMPELSKFSFNPENSKYEIIQSDLEHPEKFLKISALINGDIHLSELYEREISYSEERLSTSNILKRVVLTSHLLELDPTQVFGSKIIENATNRLLTGPLSPTLPIDTTVAQVRRWIAPTELYTGTAIKIVKATRDLPGHLQRDINNSTPGVYDLSSNAPYIIADNIRDEEHAIKTALHEGLGHSGIISFLDRNSEMGGAEAFDVLDKIYSDIGPDEILRSLSSYSLDTNNVNDRRVAVLEYIAHLSEDISSSHMDDLINSNADLLNNLYQDVPVSWNKSEILGLIEASRINLVYEESIKRAATTGFDFSKGSPAYEHAFNSVLYDIGGLSNLLTKHSPDITTWHGTPSEVLKFDSSYIGTGEGAQSQGYGLYTTGSKEIGEIYQQRIANSQSTVSGVKYDIPELMNSYRFSDPEYSALDYYLKAGSNWIEAERLLNEDLETNTFYSVSSSEVTPELVKETMSRLEKFISPLSGRNLYQTKLSINFESMLDLDKPLTEQSIIVQNALKPYLGDLHIGKLAQDVLPQWKSEYLSQLESIGLDEQEIAAHSLAVDTIVYNDQDDEAAWSVLNRIEPSEIDLNLNSLYDITSTSGRNYFGNEVTGQYIYDQFEAKGLTSTPAQTSQLLSSIGIKGNKYLNGISRDSDTDKTIEDYNYVTFDDSNISISKTAEEVAIEESKSESQIAESQGIDVSQAASLKRAAVLGFPDTMYYLAKSESGVETYTKSVADSVSGGEVLLKFSKPYLADNQDSLNNIMSSPERLQVLKNSGFDSVVANEPQTAPVIAMFDSSQVAEANSLFISDILSVPEAAAQSTDYADTTEAIDPDTIFYVATMSKMTNIQLQEYGSPLGYGDYVDEAVFITNTPADAHSSLDLFADDLHVYPVVLKLDNSVISEDTSIEAYLSDYPVRDINTPNNRLLAFYQSTQEERLEYAHDQGYLKESIPSESEVSDFGSPLVIRSITADLSLDVKPNIDESTGLDTSTFDTSKEQLPNILLKSEHPQLDLEIQQHDVSLLPALLNNHELESSDLSAVISDSKGNNFGLSLSQSGWRSPKLVENYGEAAKNMPYATLSVPNNMSLSSSSTLLDIRQGLLDIGVVDLEVGNSKNLSMRDLNQVKQTLDIPISKPASNDTLHVELSPQSPELKAFSNARFLFAGSRSEYAPIKNLARAKAMYTENQSKEERSAMIRATGWHRGADNSWRYEIYDQNSSIHQGFLNSVKQNYQEKDVLTGTCKLREFFSHDSLYEHYPRLSELNVNFFTKHDSVSGSLGFDHSGGHSHINLYINDETSELELRKTLVHELQHYIQFVEGFAQGGNSSIDFLARSLQQAISRAELGINELVSSQWKSLVNENSAVEDIQIMEDLKALSTNPSAQEQAYKLFELDVFAVNEAKIRIAIGNPVDENQKEAFGAWVREAASELMKIHNHDFLYRNNKSIESKHEEIIENHGRRGLEKRQRLISEELTELKPEILRNSKLGDRLSTLRGLLNNLTPETAHKTYRAFGGEVEARLVSRRLHLPKSGRLRCDPIEMMDVHKNNHINIRDFPVSFTAPMSLDVIDERLSLSGVDKKAVEIVQSHNELPLELSNISKEYNQVPAGANFNGKIYLVADQLNDVSQIDEALIHEMAHGGVKTVFGSELSSSYENFWNKAGGEKGMHDLAVENGVGLYQYSAPAQDLVDSGEITAMQRKTMLVDEFVAHMVTNQQNQTFTEKAKTLVSEFIGSIRNSLRKTGLMNSATMTNSDIAFTVKAVSDASRGKFHEQPLVINNTESLATTAKRSWSWLNKVREISQSIPGALNLVNSFTNSNTKTAIDSMASYKTPRLGMINMIEDRSPESFKSIFPINPMQKNDEVRYLTTSGTINHQLHSVEQRDDRIYDLSMMNELASTQDPISIPRDEGGEVRVELLDNNLIKAVVIDTNGQEIGIATGPGVTSTIEIANKSAEPEIYQGRSMRM